jgi:hypothetical protein
LSAGAGLFALVVGVHDVLQAESVSTRLTGAAFLVAGLLLVVAAIQAKEPREPDLPEGDSWRLLLGVAAGVLAAGLGAFLLDAAWDIGEPQNDRRWLGWVALTAAGAAIALTYVVLGWGRFGRSARRPWSLVASGVTATILVALLQVWSSAVAGPGRQDPNVVLTVTLNREDETAALGRADRRGPLQAFSLTISAENRSDVPLALLGSHYTVTAAEMDPVKKVADEAYARDLRSNPGFEIPRWARPVESDLVQSGRPLGDGTVLFPDERVRTRRVVLVPSGAYDALWSSTDVVVVPQDRLPVTFSGRPSSVQKVTTGVLDTPGGQVLTDALPVVHRSWVDRLTAPDLEVRRIWFVDGRHEENALLVFPDRRGHEGPPTASSERIAEAYDTAATQATADLFIGPRDRRVASSAPPEQVPFGFTPGEIARGIYPADLRARALGRERLKKRGFKEGSCVTIGVVPVRICQVKLANRKAAENTTREWLDLESNILVVITPDRVDGRDLILAESRDGHEAISAFQYQNNAVLVVAGFGGREEVRSAALDALERCVDPTKTKCPAWLLSDL